MIPRYIHRLLGRHPKIYLKLLRWSGRGSIEKRVFLSLIRDGNIVCDIGANRGSFTRLFSDLVGRGGEVHAFEPLPTTFALLQTTLAVNGVPRNCRLNNLALGETTGTVTIHLPGIDDGQASLRTHAHGSWDNAEPVIEHECAMTTLDEYARSFRRLDFIKCDVEGAEMLVLRGASEVLARFSPVLFVEVFDEWTRSFGYRPADLMALLAEAGYDTFFLINNAVRRIDRNHPITGAANLLCGKPGTLPDVVEA